MIVPLLPIQLVDIVGSILMILFSFMCLKLSKVLKRKEPGNIVWAYLLWVCYALTIFAVSRSVGHILKQFLLGIGFFETWQKIRPYSGGINTAALLLVGSFTLFFERTFNIYQEIVSDKKKLQTTHHQLLYVNQNLENIIAERTRELSLSEKKYRRIFEISKDMIIVINFKDHIIHLNPAGIQILGEIKEPGFSIGCAIHQYFQNIKDWQKIKDAIIKSGFVSNTEMMMKRRDQTHFRTLVTGSLDKGEKREEDTIHLLIKDIEHLKEMERKMAQMDKLASIGELSSGIAHEINNPLNIILGYTQLLIRKEPESSHRFDDLKVIEKHVRSCQTIVEDLLNFARSSKPLIRKADINAIVTHVVGMMHHQIKRDQVEIKKIPDETIPEINLDEKKIRQVLINLLMNANHAVGKKGEIRIVTSWERYKNAVYIKVIDNGYGIAPHHLSRIFDPFFSTKKTGEGTGLGLSVSYGIIQNHGGDIQVASIPDEKTVFTIVLPLKR